jgi:ABC-type multidrug transport system fused ATPase/permease subunit
MTRADCARLLLRYLRPQWPRVAILAGLLFGGLGLQLANPQVIRLFLDTAESGGSQRLLLSAAAVYIVFAVAQQVMELGVVYAGQLVAWDATNALRYDLALHCLRLDLPFHKTHTPGELIQRIDGDVNGVAAFFSHFAPQVLGNALLVAGILGFLFAANWRVGLGLSLYVVLTVWILGYVQRFATERWRRANQASAELYGFIEERLGGAEDIRAAGAIPYVLYRLTQIMRTLSQKHRAAHLVSGAIFNFTNVLAVAGYVIGLALGVWLYTHGQATIGTAYLIVAYVTMLSNPLQSLREQARNLQQASAGLERVQELLRLRPQVSAESPLQAALPRGPLSVEFGRVDFSYDSQDSVLHDVSFLVRPGKVLGILGRTGSGKTTLTRLLIRLYDPDHGAIHLGGLDLRAAGLADVRARVGLVTQDVQLFQASIRDNLAFFNQRLDEASLWAALEALHISDWALALPSGLDTRLEAGGQGFSSGEAQLLAFTRVFLKDPGLVVLDEASSRLDPATESRLELALDGLFTGRTGIIVAHRLRTVQRADDILILDDGRVVEYGERLSLSADPRSLFYNLLRTGLEEVLA